MPVHEALQRQLPRLRRCGGRPRHGRADRRERQVPAAGRVQRGREAARSRGRGGRVLARGSGRAPANAASRFAGATETRKLVPAAKPATEEDYAAEFLDLIISVKVVDSLDEAIAHINDYGSKHTDAIVTTRHCMRPGSSRARVDSAAVDGQRQHAIQRRGRVRPGRRDRHQHRQIPRPRAVRARRN